MTKYELQKDIGRNVRQIRERQGISQEKLAEGVDLSPGHINQIEGGFKSFSVPSLVAAAKALNVSIDCLVYGDNFATAVENMAQILSSVSEEDAAKLNRLIEVALKEFIRPE